MDDDVGGHEGGVGQQAGVDVVGLAAHLVLEGGNAFELAEVGVHVEEQVELGGLRQVTLQVEGGLLGVDAAGQVLRHDAAGIGIDAARGGMGGERVVVRYEEEAVILLLHGDEIAQRAEIVAEVEVARGAYSTANNVFSVVDDLLFHGAKIRK